MLNRDLFLIGRRGTADLPLNSADVSREHAEIVRDATSPMRDRGSKTERSSTATGHRAHGRRGLSSRCWQRQAGVLTRHRDVRPEQCVVRVSDLSKWQRP
jgi:pSer/pThr/pTyr-binding forkhead associated (FHA) protein